MIKYVIVWWVFLVIVSWIWSHNSEPIFKIFDINLWDFWDFFNMFNPLIGGITLYFVYQTFISQRQELKATREVMEEEKFKNFLTLLLERKKEILQNMQTEKTGGILDSAWVDDLRWEGLVCNILNAYKQYECTKEETPLFYEQLRDFIVGDLYYWINNINQDDWNKNSTPFQSFYWILKEMIEKIQNNEKYKDLQFIFIKKTEEDFVKMMDRFLREVEVEKKVEKIKKFLRTKLNKSPLK